MTLQNLPRRSDNKEYVISTYFVVAFFYNVGNIDKIDIVGISKNVPYDASALAVDMWK